MFEVRTDERTQVVDVTDRVAAEVPDDATGLCTVFVRHTTAGVVVQEAESRLLADIEALRRTSSRATATTATTASTTTPTPTSGRPCSASR